MGTDQQFCLRWNNFHTSITSAFESLRDDEDFVDITLACDGKQVKAHKMVLSACSPYFRNLLKGNPCQHPIVFLKDVTFANLASILDFMYHGEVNVSHNDLATFLKTAEALKVRGLAEDDKKKDAENYIEASSPGPPRDPPDPGSPKQDETSATDTHLSDSSPPPSKRHRRRSGTSVQSAEDTSETVLSDLRETSVKNEPQEFNDEDDMLGHSLDGTGDIKTDNVSSEVNDDRNFGPSESVSISRSQAAMQQLQESFGSFLPSMSQSTGFIPHGAADMARPSFPLDGVQGLPPGISTLPGPSMSQATASQDGSQGECDKEPLSCTFCGKIFSSRYNLKKHIRDIHLNKGTKFTCDLCQRNYSSLNSLQVHRSVTHPTGNKRRYNAPTSRRRSSAKNSEDTGEESQEGFDQEQANKLAEVKEELEEVREEFASPKEVESSPQTHPSPVESRHTLIPPQAHTPLHIQHHQYPLQARISSPPQAHIPIIGLSQAPLPAHAHHSRVTIPPQAHTPLPLHMVVYSHDHTPLSPQVHQTPVSPIVQQTSVSPQVMSPQLHQTPMSPQVMSPQMHSSISPQMHPPPSPAQLESASKNYDLHSLSMRQGHHHLGGVIHHQMHHSASQQMNAQYNMQVQHAFASSPVNEPSYHSIDHSMNLQ